MTKPIIPIYLICLSLVGLISACISSTSIRYDRGVTETQFTNPIAETIRSDSVGRLQQLIASGVDVNIKISTASGVDVNHDQRLEDVVILLDDTTPLMYAASVCNDPRMIQILIGAGADIEAVDIAGRTALILSLLYNNEAQISITLIDNHADVHHEMKHGISPIIAALSHERDLTTISALLIAGVDPYALEKNGDSILRRAASSYENPIVIKAFIDLGLDINFQSNESRRQTPLMSASILNTAEIVQLLLDNGASIDLQDENGETALSFACKWNSTDVARVLINAGADIHARDKDGCTALLLACKYNDAQMVQLLLDAGSHPRTSDYEGKDGVDFALKYQYPEDQEKIIKLFDTAFSIYSYR